MENSILILASTILICTVAVVVAHRYPPRLPYVPEIATLLHAVNQLNEAHKSLVVEIGHLGSIPGLYTQKSDADFYYRSRNVLHEHMIEISRRKVELCDRIAAVSAAKVYESEL